MENKFTREFISAFFSIFKADVKECRLEGANALGIISWDEEEYEQSFSWLPKFDDNSLRKMKKLCDFLIQNDLVEGDKIQLSFPELLNSLQYNGWNATEAENIINALCSVRIKMIDDGEETDSFFVHF